MALPPWLARFNRQVTNRVTSTFASRVPGFAIVIHTGRRSGRTYRTPVNVFRDGNDYLFALTYGAERDWVRNVQAAGGCEILTRGQRITLTNPRIITDPSRRWAAFPARPILGLLGVASYLRLTRAPAPTAS